MRGLLSGLVGRVKYGDGSRRRFRQGVSGEQIISINHGRWHEACSRGVLFGYGTNQAVTGGGPNSFNSFATSKTATAQPIVGIWNPLNSGVMAALVKTQISVASLVFNTANVSGPFYYLSNTNQNAITTGNSPWNLRTFQQTGSSLKGFAGTIPLTGMTGSLTEMFTVGVANIASPNNSGTTGLNPCFDSSTVDFVEGALIVMPGNVLVVMFQAANITYIYNGGMIWEEIPL